MQKITITDDGMWNEPITLTVGVHAQGHDMYTPGAIILYRESYAPGIPVGAECAIHSDGRITLRVTEWSQPDGNYYWHLGASEDLTSDTVTEAQKDALARLWARDVDLDGWEGNVGSTPQRLAPDILDRVQRLTGRIPAIV